MNAMPAAEDTCEAGGREFATGAGYRDDLAAAREKFRRAAFVGVDVRHLVANDAVVAPAKLGERQRIGRRAVEYKEDRALRREELVDQPLRARGPLVIAVG